MIPRLTGRAALIVDRDPDTRRMYAQYLRFAGLVVAEADEGRQALVMAFERRYDLIIMDTQLPGIDGYQLAEVLRRDPSTQAVPIIVVTGEGSASAVERARKAGANAVLVKPSLPDVVLAEVRRLLDASPVAASVPDDGRQPQIDVRPSRMLNRAHRRGETLAPPMQPPKLICPQCSYPMLYERSYIGGVSAKYPEQWDEYECRNGCGRFQYRQRTRKVRQR